MCLFVGRLVGWFVRSFVNILPTAAMSGWGAFSSCTYLLYKPSYSKFTVKIVVTTVTGVGLRQTLLPQLNWATTKTPYLVQESRTYLLYKPSYSQFSVKIYKFLNFRYHGNGGRCETNFATTVKLADPENPQFGANSVHENNHELRIIADLVVIN